MNPIISELLDAAEDYQGKVTDRVYKDLLEMLQKYHNATPEGIDSERQQKEQQVRDDEAAARQLASNIVGGAQEHYNAEEVANMYGMETTIGNVVLHTAYHTQYVPGYIYHRFNFGGRHTVRNPVTGIFVIMDGKRGKQVLQDAGSSVAEITSLLET